MCSASTSLRVSAFSLISTGYRFIDLLSSTIKKIVQCVALEASNINKQVTPSNEITEPLELTVSKKELQGYSHSVTVMF